ncbi:MAG: DinB family protein [Chitinophagaceae bacterium]|nr:DinB family protein [Chitinophagaceae bacterium]
MIRHVIDRITNELTDTFNEIFHWFESDTTLLNYKPAGGGWSVIQILEHISLTNHYLLILIHKGAVKALEKAKNSNFSSELENYDLDWYKLKAIGEHQSFEWNRPVHMEPTGLLSLQEIRRRLDMQLSECLSLLNQLSNGEGVLYKTTMTVNNLDKIDVYHYIYFLVQHAKRHLMQMEKLKNNLS